MVKKLLTSEQKAENKIKANSKFYLKTKVKTCNYQKKFYKNNKIKILLRKKNRSLRIKAEALEAVKSKPPPLPEFLPNGAILCK